MRVRPLAGDAGLPLRGVVQAGRDRGQHPQAQGPEGGHPRPGQLHGQAVTSARSSPASQALLWSHWVSDFTNKLFPPFSSC